MSQDNWEEDNEFDLELDNGIDDLESPGQHDVYAATNVPGLICPTGRLQNIVETEIMTVSAM